MGNWRRVEIIGTCSGKDVPALAAAIDYKRSKVEDFHCLMHTGSLMGLPLWANTEIHAVGNLAERDFDINDVVDALDKLIAVAPSLNVKIHVGDDNESSDCMGTVTIGEDGGASWGPPQAESIPMLTDDQMRQNFVRAMNR